MGYPICVPAGPCAATSACAVKNDQSGIYIITVMPCGRLNLFAPSGVSNNVETIIKMIENLNPAGPPAEIAEDRFPLLIDKHQRQIYSLALRLTGNAAAADDITQETFISAWKHLKGFRGESSLKTWLFRIATNKVRSYWRWKKIRSWVGLGARNGEEDAPALEDILPDRPEDRPEQTALAADMERRVQAAIDILPPRQREVATLRAQGISMAGIADTLTMAEGTVKAHWFEARKKLTASLGEYL